MNFYNRINLNKQELSLELAKVKKLRKKIICLFHRSKDKGLTPAEVYMILNQVYPITSIRRSISDMTDKEGLLVKTKKRRPGIYGIGNFVWKLK